MKIYFFDGWIGTGNRRRYVPRTRVVSRMRRSCLPKFVQGYGKYFFFRTPIQHFFRILHVFGLKVQSLRLIVSEPVSEIREGGFNFRVAQAQEGENVFVRTARNETLEIHADQAVRVKPTGKASWLLFTVVDGEEVAIGSIDHIEEANAALVSLREAIQADLGWDFRQYIEDYD